MSQPHPSSIDLVEKILNLSRRYIESILLDQHKRRQIYDLLVEVNKLQKNNNIYKNLDNDSLKAEVLNLLNEISYFEMELNINPSGITAEDIIKLNVEVINTLSSMIVGPYPPR